MNTRDIYNAERTPNRGESLIRVHLYPGLTVVIPNSSSCYKQDLVLLSSGQFSRPRRIGNLVECNTVENESYVLQKYLEYSYELLKITPRKVGTNQRHFDGDGSSNVLHTWMWVEKGRKLRTTSNRKQNADQEQYFILSGIVVVGKCSARPYQYMIRIPL